MTNEQIFIGSCLLDNSLIDHAIQAGIKADSFECHERARIWRSFLGMRVSGRPVDSSSAFLEMGDACPAGELFACEQSVSTSAHGKKALKSVVDAAAIRKLKPALFEIQAALDEGTDLKTLKGQLEALESILKPSEPSEQSLPEIAKDALLWAKEQASGAISSDKVVLTGLPRFDERAGGIQKHEYVVVGARTSTGKSSFMTQMAGVNLARGLSVAYFTLETSSRSVFLQIAAQRHEVNLRRLRDEMPNKLDKFYAEIESLKAAPLHIFEKDLSLEQIEARCRLLCASSKPDVVFIDYLGLMKTPGDGAYERMTRLSKACIHLKKSLPCALVVAAQLNRGNEKDDRPPSRTDFRDSGSIEEDAHRILAIHRPSKDDTGQLQGFDRAFYQQELYQLKLRDGPLAQTRMQFNSICTKFKEDI